MKAIHVIYLMDVSIIYQILLKFRKRRCTITDCTCWYFEEDNECFSRCRYCCKMLLGIYTPCARVLFSRLDGCTTSHLVVGQVSRISGGSVSCDLWHRRKVASLSAFFKIDSLVDHPVRGLFPRHLLRCLGLEPCSFCAFLFCLVFDCGMGCMNLSLLVKVWVLLKLQSFTRLTARCFFLLFDYFSFIFPFTFIF